MIALRDLLYCGWVRTLVCNRFLTEGLAGQMRWAPAGRVPSKPNCLLFCSACCVDHHGPQQSIKPHRNTHHRVTAEVSCVQCRRGAAKPAMRASSRCRFECTSFSGRAFSAVGKKHALPDIVSSTLAVQRGLWGLVQHMVESRVYASRKRGRGVDMWR